LSFCALCAAAGYAQPSLAKPAQRQSAPWPPPKGELRVIIDTDAANEVDDQWAIVLALGFPERFKIEGFVAAHYGQSGGAGGIAKSRASLEATLSAALLKDPSIAGRIIIFWHGRSEWPEKCANFNAMNDPLAAQLLFELPCRFVLFDTGTDLTMPMDECERRVGSVGPLLRIKSIDRDACFRLLDQALSRIAKTAPPTKP
jgi:hypothetical protein